MLEPKTVEMGHLFTYFGLYLDIYVKIDSNSPKGEKFQFLRVIIPI